MSIELKIKSKHLALEAGVIRFEEHKLLKQLKWLRAKQQPTDMLERSYRSISEHRKWDVRNENRATFLARAYIAGKPYKTVEQSVKDPVLLHYHIIHRVAAMVSRYHDSEVTRLTIDNWIKAGLV